MNTHVYEEIIIDFCDNCFIELSLISGSFEWSFIFDIFEIILVDQLEWNRFKRQLNFVTYWTSSLVNWYKTDGIWISSC